MKITIILSLFVLGLLSCSKDDLDGFPQLWQIKYNTNTFNEVYFFNSDGTFLKMRQKDGSADVASGEFSIGQSNNEKFFKLIYDKANDPLIGSCGRGEETMWIRSDSTFVSTWYYCDGPFLEYGRIK